jgi:hypothetical protein
MIEKEIITLEDGLSFATNQNNLLLQLKGLSSTEDYANAPREKTRNADARLVVPPPTPRNSVLDMIEK